MKNLTARSIAFDKIENKVQNFLYNEPMHYNSKESVLITEIVDILNEVIEDEIKGESE